MHKAPGNNVGGRMGEGGVVVVILYEMKKAHFVHAKGSSKLPGTDCTTMFDSLTPLSFSLEIAPATSASTTVLFQRA
jgi:hypothetical protein